MGLGPIGASQKALERADLNIKDIDIDTSIKLQDGGIQKIRTKLSIINLE